MLWRSFEGWNGEIFGVREYSSVCVTVNTASMQPLTGAAGLRAADPLLNVLFSLFSFSAGHDIDHDVRNPRVPSPCC